MADASLIQVKVQAMDPVLGADSRLTTFVTMAITAHRKSSWGAVYYDAMAFWTLHRIAMAIREAGGATGIAGPVQSQKTGDVSVSYAASAMMAGAGPLDGDLPQTSWGRQYLLWRKSRAAGHAGVIRS